MSRPAIGVDVDDFRLSTKDALRRAAELQFRAVEFATVSGELAPTQLSPSGRRHLSRYVDGLGLSVAALRADVPQMRLTDPKTAEERVALTCLVLEMAADMGVPVVTAAIGATTHPETGEPSPMAVEALRRIGEFADSRGTIFAVRPSRDSADRLVRLLDKVSCPSIGVNLDPAAQIMAGADPFRIIERFAGHIPLVHMRDATAGSADRAGRETRFGEGDVDLEGMVVTLDAAAYGGAYIIRRTDTETPAADLDHARGILNGMLPPE